MNTKTITAVTAIAVIAIICIGAGYAYTGLTTTDNNKVEDAQILVKPGITADNNFTPKFTGSAGLVQYNSKIDASSSYNPKYEIDVTSNLTDINTIRLDNSGSVASDVTKLSIKMNLKNLDLYDQLATGDYKDCTLTMTVSSTSATISADTTATKKLDSTNETIEWAFNITNCTIAAGKHLDCTFAFTIGADTAGDYPHALPLDKSVFTIDFKATANVHQTA